MNLEKICSQECFLGCVEQHNMHIIMDETLHKHLRFRKPGSSIYGFDLITWPGHLCIAGDMGSYVFAREQNMLTFFRPPPRNDGYLQISPDYWGEKVIAQDVRSPVKVYSREKFREAVREWFDEQDGMVDKELWREIEDHVLTHDDNEYMAINAAMEFSYKGDYIFSDFWDVSLKEFSHQFIWCCYAIVWGIRKYDQEATQ